MTEPTITCPNCKTEIKVTESLAAPLLETTKRDYEQRLAQKEAERVTREAAIQEREAALAKDKETLDEQVAEKLKHQRAAIAAEEAKRLSGRWPPILNKNPKNSPSYKMF